MLAAVMLLLRGVIEQAVTGLHKRVGASKLGAPSIILLPAVGGLLFGLVAMAAPLTIGDGSLPLFTIAGDGYSAYWARTGKALVAEFCGPTACAGNSTAARQALQVAKLQAQVALNKLQYEDALIPGWPNPSIDDRTYSASLIVGTLFLKMAAWAICQAFGFVGGIIFPFLFVGACAGNLAAQVRRCSGQPHVAVLTSRAPCSGRGSTNHSQRLPSCSLSLRLSPHFPSHSWQWEPFSSSARRIKPPRYLSPCLLLTA